MFSFNQYFSVALLLLAKLSIARSTQIRTSSKDFSPINFCCYFVMPELDRVSKWTDYQNTNLEEEVLENDDEILEIDDIDKHDERRETKSLIDSNIIQRMILTKFIGRPIKYH